ncbi:MAG: HAMP domain-containing protein [Candidatus Aenigmarchaeota archaeon]|nr:HAMP domain-containing protein [Candidatus Aenigmarchaeota archaeon]
MIIGLTMLVVADAASKASIEEQVKSKLDSVTKSRASHVKEFLNRYVEGLSLVSSRTQLRLSLDSYNKDGKIEHKEKMRRILNDAISSIKDFKDIFILNLDGKVVVSTDENLENRDYSNEEFFVKGRGGNNLFFVSDENSEPFFRLSGPLLLNEELIGVTVIISKANSLFEIFSDYTGMGETGELYLIDKDGYMITPPRFEGPTGFKHKVDTQEANLCLREHTQEGLPKEMEEIPIIYVDYRGVNVLGTHAYIPEMEWCMLTEIGEAEAFLPYLNLQRNLILIAVVFVIFSLVISVLVSRSITKPIVKLRDVASEIGKGRLDTKIEVESKDEVGELASAFRQMTEDLRVYQAQIRKHAEELEEKVKERTKELDTKIKELTETKTAVLNMMEDTDETNKELIKTQEELKKSLSELKEMDIKKNQFISIAAHELKTPLTSIHGFSQLLQDRKVANNFTKRNKYLKIMDHETKRLAKLVTDILDLSRIDLGTVKLSLDEVDVNELVKGLEREMDVQIKGKGLKSEYDVEKDIPRIVTDREKLTEILINLIINAVKYTSEGIITVNVLRENKKMHFVVKDTGIGIVKEKQGKIFERFYQIDSSYTRKTPGVGLGLALCKEFVELLGGKIWIESELGKGSEFHFTLPLKGVSKKQIREEERRAEESLKKAEETGKRVKRLGIGK